MGCGGSKGVETKKEEQKPDEQKQEVVCQSHKTYSDKHHAHHYCAVRTSFTLIISNIDVINMFIFIEADSWLLFRDNNP